MDDDNHNLNSAEYAGPAPAQGETTPIAPQLPEDIRVPWGWLDLVLLIPLTVGGLFFLVIVTFIGLALSGVAIGKIQQSPEVFGLISVAAQTVLDLAVLGYLAMQMRVRFHSPFWRTIGWRPLESTRLSRSAICFLLGLGGFLLAIVVAWVDSLYPPKAELPIETLLQGHATLVLFMLTAVLVAPLVEETVFRGYLYPVAARTFGVTGGILITGTLFGLMHGVQLWGGWWQIAMLVVVGIVFTLARARTGTVVASYVLHVSYNSLQVIALLIGTHGLRHIPGAH